MKISLNNTNFGSNYKFYRTIKNYPCTNGLELEIINKSKEKGFSVEPDTKIVKDEYILSVTEVNCPEEFDSTIETILAQRGISYSKIDDDKETTVSFYKFPLSSNFNKNENKFPKA